jgi:hypothetical protein
LKEYYAVKNVFKESLVWTHYLRTRACSSVTLIHQQSLETTGLQSTLMKMVEENFSIRLEERPVDILNIT